MLGAIYLDGGIERADAFVRAHWAPFLDDQKRAPVHPKSALQEIAAEKKLGVPVYEQVSRYGPHHAPRFRVRVSLGKHGEAEAEGDSKQEAETAAAAVLLERFQ
jgi:ribonuclease-3